MKKLAPEVCPICGEGTWQPHSDGTYVFRHGRKEHKVPGQHYALCDKCGLRGYLPGQREENSRLVKAYQDSQVGYISPSDVLAVREKYQLTQTQANLIFGGGTQGFSKWERGVTSPAGPTARLIKLALRYPEVMRELGKEAGIELASAMPKEDVRVRVVHVVVDEQSRDNLFPIGLCVKPDYLSEADDTNITAWPNQNPSKKRAYLN